MHFLHWVHPWHPLALWAPRPSGAAHQLTGFGGGGGRTEGTIGTLPWESETRHTGSTYGTTTGTTWRSWIWFDMILYQSLVPMPWPRSTTQSFLGFGECRCHGHLWRIAKLSLWNVLCTIFCAVWESRPLSAWPEMDGQAGRLLHNSSTETGQADWVFRAPKWRWVKQDNSARAAIKQC